MFKCRTLCELAPGEIAVAAHDGFSLVEPFSCVAPEPVQWLWENRLAIGELALLEGDPGVSKSLVALDLCARLSTGRPMPDATPSPGIVNSLVLQTEDSHRKTVRPRLQALGADEARVFRWKPAEGSQDPLRLPSQRDLLERAIRETDARLVILDPLVDFLDARVCVNLEQSIRAALASLQGLARDRQCVILMIRHLVKRMLARALYRGGGSIGIAAVCRSAWLVGSDPTQEARRVLAQVKNSYAEPQASLAFELRREGDLPATPVWLGPTSWAADQLVLAPAAAPERDRAMEFLQEFLREGPRLSTDIWTTAVERGFSEPTLRRARTKLGVQFQRVNSHGIQRTYWLLQHQELSAALRETGKPGESDDQGEFMRLLAEQEKKFPRPCPLDESDTP
jgi:hypothetical protein